MQVRTYYSVSNLVPNLARGTSCLQKFAKNYIKQKSQFSLLEFQLLHKVFTSKIQTFEKVLY